MQLFLEHQVGLLPIQSAIKAMIQQECVCAQPEIKTERRKKFKYSWLSCIIKVTVSNV